MGDAVIRPYEASDRAAVRRICFETGYMGDPVAWQWRDAESFADLFSGWYTDHNGHQAYVAEVGGNVAGYLLGCCDSRRVGSPMGVVGGHLLRRGLLIRPGTAPVLWRAAADLIIGLVHDRSLPPDGFHDERWPAHLHIDLLPEARGHGVGAALVTTWIDRLTDAGSPGCHVETWAENDGAVAFFTSMGFETRGDPVPMPGIRSPEGHRHHTQLLVRSLP